MKNPIINFNREWIEATPELLHVLTPGVIRGQGIFETILVEDGQVCFWEEHFKRFQQGARLFKIKIPFSPGKWLRDVKKTLQLNRLTGGRVRISLYTDQGRSFSSIVAGPLKAGSAGRDSFKTTVSSFRRKKDKYSRAKSLEYQPFYDARQEAQANGFDEALLLDPSGILVEGAATNLFFIEKGKLHTPSTACGCLNGIVRQQVVALARSAGVRVLTGRYRLDRLFKADEVFLTNSLIGLKTVSAVDGHPVGNGQAPVTARLQKLYQKRLKYS